MLMAAGGNWPAAQADPDSRALHVIMAEIARTTVDFYPQTFNDAAFEKAYRSGRIGRAVRRLKRLFDEAAPLIASRSVTYQLSYDLILDYLSETERWLGRDHLDYVQDRLRGLTVICRSCHTQDTQLRTLFAGVPRERFDSDLRYAEFNFSTRNYALAVTYFDRFLSESAPQNGHQLLFVLQSLMVIDLQILNDPEAAMRHLRKYLPLPAHSRYSRRVAEAWLAGLRQLPVSLRDDADAALDFATLEQYVQRYLGPEEAIPERFAIDNEETVWRIWLRGRLFHYLNGQPKSEEIPKILYWLAICDRSIELSSYFSLSDIYLKDCILRFHHHPYARKCLTEYENYVTFSFSGSAGTNIPEDVAEEIRRLHEVVGGSE